MRLVISQEQSWPSGLLLYLISDKWAQCWFVRLYSRQNPKFDGGISVCPDVTAGVSTVCLCLCMCASVCVCVYVHYHVSPGVWKL